jgi:chromosome segregation ATPase
MRTDKSALALSPKITNWMVLGSVAFGVSFFLSLVVNRDIGKALLTGVITIPATYTGTVIIHKRRINLEKRLRNSLQNQIQKLEQYKDDLNQFLFDALAQEQEIEASINTLESELNYLRGQVSEGYNQRKSISWELAGFQEQKQQQSAELYSLQSEINKFEEQIKQLNQILLTKTAEIRKAETDLNSIKSEIRQVQAQIVEQQNEKQALEQELLQIQIQKSLLLEEENQTRDSLSFFSLELIQLQAQVAKQQNEQQATNQELLNLREEKSKLEEELHHFRSKAESPSVQLPLLPTPTSSLPKDWMEFMTHISDYELRVIKAIAQQDNPLQALKRIAEENLTMPEVLIDSINNRAMDTIGDRLIEPGSISIPPVIAEEYLSRINQLIEAYE